MNAAAPLALECGHCSCALELAELPATLVTQCKVCGKALDLAPFAERLARPARPAKREPAPLVSVTEAGVTVQRQGSASQLSLGSGTGWHPSATGAALFAFYVCIWSFPLMQWSSPALLLGVAALPATYTFLTWLFGRWELRLTEHAVVRTLRPWGLRTQTIERSKLRRAWVRADTWESRGHTVALHSVEVLVDDSRGLVLLVPYLRDHAAAAVVVRELLAWSLHPELVKEREK